MDGPGRGAVTHPATISVADHAVKWRPARRFTGTIAVGFAGQFAFHFRAAPIGWREGGDHHVSARPVDRVGHCLVGRRRCLAPWRVPCAGGGSVDRLNRRKAALSLDAPASSAAIDPPRDRRLVGYPVTRRCAARFRYSAAPQYLQCSASRSCPSRMHCGQTWVVTGLPPL